MVKAKPNSTKYIIYGKFEADGLIEASDLIGSFFSQTEGLLGDELELSIMQKTGKLGRIDVDCFKKGSKTQGKFKIPTSIDKINVSLLAATLESIEKIGHSRGKISILNIEDAREELREKIYKRAEVFLKNLEETLPKSNSVNEVIRIENKKKSILKYKNKEIYYTNSIYEHSEVILVEGRADVANLVKNNIDNVISFNGSQLEEDILDLIKDKSKICFLDNDRGGKLELQALINKGFCDYYTFSIDGKDVEDLNIKEIQDCLKKKKKVEEISTKNNSTEESGIISKNIDIIKNLIPKNSIFKNYFSKFEFEKIEKFVLSIKDSNTYLLLNSKYRKIKSGRVGEFDKIEKTSGKILIIDGICEGTIIKKATELGIEMVICKKKSSVLKKNNLNIKTFNDFLE